jgi:RimJ/RimL family protein N-acetyltransferase
MDGMWESSVIAHATFWEIHDGDQRVGHLCEGSDHDLLRFHLLKSSRVRAQEAFRRIVTTRGIQQAITSTIEPPYLSLCLDAHERIVIHSYLFQDNESVETSHNENRSVFRKIEYQDFDEVVRFYYENATGSGNWIELFICERLHREELTGLYEQQVLVATGECIPSEVQPPYADIGVVVARAHRGRGLGSSMLVRLKNRCYEAGWKPICSCTVDNHASKRAIEKAGFISEHRMVKILF